MFTVSLAPIYDHNIGAVHQLVNAAFPVGFSERLVAKMLEQPASRAFSRLAYYKDIPIGVICAWPQSDGVPVNRKMCQKKKRFEASLYVGALAVLPRFQKQGVGFQLLKWLEDYAARVNAHEGATPTKHDQAGPRIDEADDTGVVIGVLGIPLTLTEVSLHCWVGNPASLAFYDRQGFNQVRIVQHFYERIDEPHAAVLVKSL